MKSFETETLAHFEATADEAFDAIAEAVMELDLGDTGSRGIEGWGGYVPTWPVDEPVKRKTRYIPIY